VSSPPLLLLNGYAATQADWDPTFIAALSERSTVLTPEHTADSIEAMAAHALAALDAEGIERAAVAGWSMGGYVAQTLAATAPGRVSHLVLMSTDPGAESVPPPPDIWAALTDRSGTPREQATRLIGLLFPPRVAKMIDQSFGEVVAEARARLTPEWLDAQERAMVGWHRQPGADRLAAIRAPALIAWGDQDAVIPPENSALLARALPGAWVCPFAGGGHAFMAQEPDRLAATINAFLGR
jgi:pimeloyl-ACP methyl ester carboxylesterase